MKHLLLELLLLTAVVTANAADVLRLKVVPGQQSYTFTLSQTGNFWLSASAESKIPVGQQHFATIRLDDGQLLTRRLLAYNNVRSSGHLERFPLEAGKKYTLFFQYDDQKTRVDELFLTLEKPYPVPKAAASYRPALLPTAPHPRVLINAGYLSWLKSHLTAGENLPVWQEVERTALAPCPPQDASQHEISYNSALIRAVQARSFYYLVTGEAKVGREAIELFSSYLQKASFGNGQDICRKVGEAIFTASLVYDWCYRLLTPQEKMVLHDRMIFFAATLETSWPPFHQNAAAGHGNEAQFSRDLMAMAIALYDEDPQPWSYVAYQMLENWKPIKSFTHASGRHSQGSSYGQYRAKFDFLAALQFKRTFGVEILPKEAAELPYYWYYLRTPDGCFLIEGDDNWKVTRPQYLAINPLLLHCLIALYPNPEFKMELQRGKKPCNQLDPVLFLLTNDPSLRPQDRRAQLPLTRLYKAPLPGMAVRTGWDFTKESDDAVLTMNGGNYHFNNHQHGDLGSFQIYYRGCLIQDLGQYNYYRIPYDRLLNKTAALHSMMRFYDPRQKKPPKESFWINVGGQKTEEDRPPLSLTSLLKEPRFYCGETPYAGFGPLKDTPVYNFMEAKLAPAYGDRLNAYTRTFVFWNQRQHNRPGTLLILDRFTVNRPDIQPIFQLTTAKRCDWAGGVLSIRNGPADGKSGSASVIPLIPEKPSVKILTGDASRTFQGTCLPARRPEREEAQGSRIEITGGDSTEFLHAIQIHDSALSPLPVKCTRMEKSFSVLLSDSTMDYLAVIGDPDALRKDPLSLSIDRNDTQVLVLDLTPGAWELISKGKNYKVRVEKDSSALYATLSAGTWIIRPVSEGK